MIDPSRVAIIVQARTSSARLPGKVLMPLAGEPAIVRMMERVSRVTRAAQAVVATSAEPSDDGLAALCRTRGIACRRGPLDDVLGRMVAAVPPDCDVVVRLTGDCPLIDPALVDEHINRFAAESHRADYVSNAVVRTYPDGLDVEVMTRAILEQASRSATLADDREHVTSWIQRYGRHVAMTQPVDASSLRWVLDTPADFDCIAGIYAALYSRDPAFDSRAIYRLLLSRPDLISMARGSSSAHMIHAMRELTGMEAAR